MQERYDFDVERKLDISPSRQQITFEIETGASVERNSFNITYECGDDMRRKLM